jgi:hypothetical protein
LGYDCKGKEIKMITLVIVMSLAAVVLATTIMSSSVFDLSNLGSVSSKVLINGETPDAVLADELSKGNIDKEVYEIFVAEKMDLKLI